MKTWIEWLLAGLVLLLPPLAWWGLPGIPPQQLLPVEADLGGTRYEPTRLPLERRSLSDPGDARPFIANVQVIDFDDDGQSDILVCDAKQNCLKLLTATGQGPWKERVLARDLAAPAHATVLDMDGDGDRDVVVSLLGDILPNDGMIGRLVWLENTDDGFETHQLLDDVRRVADCQPGDFDGDGDVDLAVAVFGYARGQVLWLENRGEGRFRDHELLNAPGTIHVPVADFDGDGDLDIAAIVSQEDEELWAFENLGKGEFRKRRLWFTINDDLGSAGLVADDLDQDGDVDLLLPVGDNLEIAHCHPQPYHGCLWFENTGNWQFEMRRIADLGTTYACAVGDLDADGDRDVVLVSLVNNWTNPENASVVWLENDGRQNFTPWQIDNQPTHRVTVAVGDLDGDGRLDVVTGGLHLNGPFDRVGGVVAWFQRRKEGGR